ncbi:hypothetical protein TrCOL_g8982 [Triparma columacea]|uniref:Uncharacterized protein n=1 Tax=Triparma columacea TaxID=722753 RepID=A0A9W7GM73_9STRA|nr:hypothetical protein TrCOL_g8982 [Triparma columacea]
MAQQGSSTLTMNEFFKSCTTKPVLILWFYFGYYLAVQLQHQGTLTSGNWLTSAFTATLIGIANNSAGIGDSTLRDWFLSNPRRFLLYFCIPFCVSSLSICASKHEEDFWLVFSTNKRILGTSLGTAAGVVVTLKVFERITRGGGLNGEDKEVGGGGGGAKVMEEEEDNSKL